MSTQQTREAADLLWDSWTSGIKLVELPARLRPTTRKEGYAIQALLEERTAAPLYGWKIAATSVAGQAHIGVDGPLAGRLLAERVQLSGASMSIAGNGMRVIEPEFAFRIAHDLPPRSKPYAVDEVLDAVAALHPAIEVPDSRYQDFVQVGAPQLIADNACAHRFVLGTASPADWRNIDLIEHVVVAEIEGKYRREGKGANVLGDPRVALTWLANELSRLSITLARDQVVTTGTCVVPLEVGARDRAIADFGVLGSVSVSFTER